MIDRELSTTTSAAERAFLFDGGPVVFGVGDTIGSALARAGILRLRSSLTGMPRGLYCGIGVCNECLVEIDGELNRRACMTMPKVGAIVRAGHR